MKKITLPILNLLVALASIGTPVKMQGAITDPVTLDPAALEAVIKDRSKAISGYLTKQIGSLMVNLATIDHDNRFDQALSPPCDYRFREKTDLTVYSYSLKAVCDELIKICDVVLLEAIILDFCEGWNDYTRYLNGEYSAQQIIKYYTERIPRTRKKDVKVDAYAAGINTAAAYCGKKTFFWTNPRLYKYVGSLEPIPEETI